MKFPTAKLLLLAGLICAISCESESSAPWEGQSEQSDSDGDSDGDSDTDSYGDSDTGYAESPVTLQNGVDEYSGCMDVTVMNDNAAVSFSAYKNKPEHETLVIASYQC